MTLIPYLFVAAYGLKLAWTGETYAAEARGRAVDSDSRRGCDGLRGRHDLRGRRKFLLLSALLYAPGTALFIIARREQKKTAFTLVEALLFGVILVAAAAGLYSLATGAISISGRYELPSGNPVWGGETSI